MNRSDIQKINESYTGVLNSFNSAAGMHEATAICDRYYGGNLDLSGLDITELPSNMPEYVNGTLNLSNNKLTSLKGCTSVVISGFICRNNELTTLEGGPTEVDGHYDCRSNFIETLAGSPQSLIGPMYCADNPLKSLEGAPRMFGDFSSDQFSNEEYNKHIARS